jgi:hypothetical protein
MRRLSFGVFALFAALSLAGGAIAREDTPKKPTDEEVAKLLVGKWTIDEGDGKTEPKIKGTMNYKKDGTLEGEATIEFGDMKFKLTVSATWKVKDGVITETVTKTSDANLVQEGVESKDTLVSIDGKIYKFKDEKGKERSYKRIKD